MLTPYIFHRTAAASTTRSLFLLLLLSCQQIAGILGKLQLCEVETGQTNIILDIEESRGDFIGQQTTPPELPIYGNPHTGIALDLVFPKGNPAFLLDGKKLQLLQPLDRDEENLRHIVFQSTHNDLPPHSSAGQRCQCYWTRRVFYYGRQHKHNGR